MPGEEFLVGCPFAAPGASQQLTKKWPRATSRLACRVRLRSVGPHKPSAGSCAARCLIKGGKVMPVVPYYLGRPAQVWIAAMSSPARATAATSCAATSPATGMLPASPRPAVPTAQRKTHQEASPPQPRPQAPAAGMRLGKQPVHPRAAAPSVLTTADSARGDATIDRDDLRWTHMQMDEKDHPADRGEGSRNRRSADSWGTSPCRGTLQPCLTCNKARLGAHSAKSPEHAMAQP